MTASVRPSIPGFGRLGLLLLPWTTLMYLLMWSVVGGVSGAEWLVVALGVVLDLASYSSRYAKSRYDGRYPPSSVT